MTRKQSMIWLSTSSLWLQSACKKVFSFISPFCVWTFLTFFSGHKWCCIPLLQATWVVMMMIYIYIANKKYFLHLYQTHTHTHTHTSADTHAYLRHTFESYFLIIQKSVSLYFLFFKLPLLLSPPFFFCLSIPEKVLWGTYFSMLWNYNYQEK